MTDLVNISLYRGKVTSLFLALSLFFQISLPGYAASNIPENVLIRDAEIEQTLKDYLSPIFKVAGLDPTHLNILIFNSSEVNAAAGLGHTIIINTGLILRSENVGQLIGVLAHETGHVAGRHNERLSSVGKEAGKPVLGAILIAAAASIATGSPAPLLAGAVGIDAVHNTVFTYLRSHEGAADQAAFKYMEKLGWSSKGFEEFMEILRKQELLSEHHQFAYKRTHPFMIERLRLIEKHLADSKFTNTPFPQGFVEKYNRMKVKIFAFTQPPAFALQQYPPSDKSLIARYTRAIAYHRQSKTKLALSEINSLIQEQPNDPFFHELKAQILFETGSLMEARTEYMKAVKLLPECGLLKMELAHVLLEIPDSQFNQEVIHLLSQIHHDEDNSPRLWRMYATAYGRLDNPGMAALMLAEEAVQLNDIEKAHKLADRALEILPISNQTSRQRAQDIKVIVEKIDED